MLFSGKINTDSNDKKAMFSVYITCCMSSVALLLVNVFVDQPLLILLFTLMYSLSTYLFVLR